MPLLRHLRAPLQSSILLRPRSPCPLPKRPTTSSLQQSNHRTIRPLSSTSSLRIKEDAGDRSPEHVEAMKQEQLRKQEKGEGEWHEELASGGESAIKADREGVKGGDHEEHMEELQKMTAESAEKEKGQDGQ
ncbi:hypothetical protein LTS18_003422 [Coniosporium uncinatum]|uniref:Uncharacterized protein n=1 Tax=Coniosporium uncinatum TaxID=93489 RepID=A0ACC3DTZ4_9PEZI|nr:hypothetical protein LTS18_003422 [Coniosporium uncinatum]